MKPLSEGMTLYHGSYCAVVEPDLSKCSKYKDFGQGFYLTTSLSQARSFAKISATKAKSNGIVPTNEKYAWVSVFRATDISELKCFVFHDADIEWLHCIIAHRRNGAFTEIRKKMIDYDVICGKIANDDTNATITAYMGNVFGQMGSANADNVCIGLLIPQRLKDQYCFRSQRAISSLKFISKEAIDLEP